MIGVAGLALLATIACGSSSDTPAAAPVPHSERVTAEVQQYVQTQLDTLATAAEALCVAAPPPDDDGWNAASDRAAVATMRDRWREARAAYERIEGAIAILFPSLDLAVDGRYEHFVERRLDPDLFNGTGAVGMHAVERILWADLHRDDVVRFESAMRSYRPAAFPASREEAGRFRSGLCTQLVTDVRTMRDQSRALALDPDAAFRGVVGSIEEQLEKVALAQTGEDESRYAQETLDDMRANLEGGRRIYGPFRAWLIERPGGAALDRAIAAGFERLERAYRSIRARSIPPVPDGFDPEHPSAEHLATSYGRLFARVRAEADRVPAADGGLAGSMLAAARLLGIPELPSLRLPSAAP